MLTQYHTLNDQSAWLPGWSGWTDFWPHSNTFLLLILVKFMYNNICKLLWSHAKLHVQQVFRLSPATSIPPIYLLQIAVSSVGCMWILFVYFISGSLHGGCKSRRVWRVIQRSSSTDREFFLCAGHVTWWEPWTVTWGKAAINHTTKVKYLICKD